MSNIVKEKVTPEFKKWVSYCEKNSKSQLGTYDKPENYTANAGTGNYTVFAELYKSKTGINVQGQPWCDCFYDTVLIHLFGVNTARKLLIGFSAYTPTSAAYYVNKKQWYKTPQEGDQIFFHNGTRIYHTGYVYKVDSKYVYTIEGNTSSSTILENEGGCVAYKKYPLGWTDGKRRIAGYGRPDWSIVEPAAVPPKKDYDTGWHQDANGWWYAYGTVSGSYYRNCWQVINHHWYYFGSDGYVYKDWHEINGEWFYFQPNGSLEGALWHEKNDRRGALEVWYIS